VSFAFLEDTSVGGGPGRYTATVTDRWTIGGRPNGGYLMGIVLRAMAGELHHRDPLSVTGHFLSPADPGEAEVEVEVAKAGRSLSTARATLSQGGRQRLTLIGTFGDLDRIEGPTRMDGPPSVDGDLISSRGRAAPFPIVERFEFQLPADQATAASGMPPGDDRKAEFLGRIRFSDGLVAPATAYPLLVDAYPPAVFNWGLVGWTPTIELTVHGRGRATGEWLILHVKSRFLRNGLLEEDAELWNPDGSLVAQSRQLARVLMSGPPSGQPTRQ
jgi:hypothetical protein